MASIEMRSRRNSLYQRLLSGPALIILLTCCFFEVTAASNNPKYEACKQEVCGNVSLKYPFWINSDFCGLGGFRIECNSSQLVMDLIFGHYLIQINESIHYEQGFLELKAKPDFNASCLPEFPYPDTSSPPPSTSPGVNSLIEVHFFYHCKNKFPTSRARPLTCSSNGINQSYIALMPSPGHQDQWFMTEKAACKSYLFTEVELEKGDISRTKNTIDYEKFFKDNLTLNYWLPLTGEQCRACHFSGGECGQSEEEGFQCFCSDCNDPETCSRGSTPKVAVPAPAPVRGIFHSPSVHVMTNTLSTQSKGIA